MPERKRFSFAERDCSKELEEVFQTGAAYLPGFLDPDTLFALQTMFKKMDPSNNSYVREHDFMTPIEIDWRNDPVGKLPYKITGKLGEYIRKYGKDYPALSVWKPNMFLPLYYKGSAWIPPHKDRGKLFGIGITLTVQGEADFSVFESANQPPFAVWRTKPGDAVFLRMEGLNPNVTYKNEIFHSIGPALTETPRISV
ncbi:MAG TPA: hypothetical protein VI489_01470, partial [Candidatus Brocadiaceae bacterium]